MRILIPLRLLRFPARSVLVCATTLAAGGLTAQAAPKPERRGPATSAAAEARTGTAQVRIWKACDATGNGLSIRLLADNTREVGKGLPLAPGTESFQFTNYVEVPAGAGNIEAELAGQQVQTRLPINFAPGAAATVLVRVREKVIHIECIDDTARTAEATPDFNVYNLLPVGGGDIQISLGETLGAHIASPGGSLRLHGIKAALYQVNASGTDVNGQPFRWNTDTDLRKNRRATLLIYPDTYGRIRPRLIEDGAGTEQTAEKAGNANG